MKNIRGNKSYIIGMALKGELNEGEEVFSISNNETYKIIKENNHQGIWMGVKVIENEKSL